MIYIRNGVKVNEKSIQFLHNPDRNENPVIAFETFVSKAISLAITDYNVWQE